MLETSHPDDKQGHRHEEKVKVAEASCIYMAKKSSLAGSEVLLSHL